MAKRYYSQFECDHFIRILWLYETKKKEFQSTCPLMYPVMGVEWFKKRKTFAHALHTFHDYLHILMIMGKILIFDYNISCSIPFYDSST